MNSLLHNIGVSLPIIQAPMAGVSTPEMAAAVSNAGGLGSIGVGAVDAETARRMISVDSVCVGSTVQRQRVLPPSRCR